MKWIIPFVAASPVWAQDCPTPTDYSAELALTVERLQATSDAQEAAPYTQMLWEMWLDAPDQQAQDLLDEGMRRRETMDFLGARVVLDQLVAYCPDYAEGYNQRAFASFLARDYEAALADLDRAIALIPNHIAALSGRGMTLLGLGREDEANASIRAALALNPWLAERALITTPEGVDI